MVRFRSPHHGGGRAELFLCSCLESGSAAQGVKTMTSEDRERLFQLFREFMTSMDDFEERIEELERRVDYEASRETTSEGVTEDQVESMIGEALDSLTFHTYID